MSLAVTSRRPISMPGSFAIAPVRAPLVSNRWLTCPRPDAAAPLRLWCLPFAGGGAAVWHPWARPLAGVAEIVAVRPPGRENRFAERPFVRLATLVAAVVDELAPYSHEDYALCGHSLGGLAVFEIARALRARGLNPPQALIVCGVRAPHHPPDQPLVHPLPHREFIEEVERRYGDIPPEIRQHPEFLELLLPVLRADLEVFETYVYAAEAPLDLPVLALGGDRDCVVSAAQLRDWRAHTTAEFVADLLPGGHFFAQENPAAATARVRAFLGRIAARFAPRPGAGTPAAAPREPAAQETPPPPVPDAGRREPPPNAAGAGEKHRPPAPISTRWPAGGRPATGCGP
jgi:medium-chain acyl-[acyl-carrier-protein] hydrolase